MNNTGLILNHHYAIQSPDGRYYTGKAGAGWLSYNKAKIAMCSWARDFTVKRVG